ncbi:MAG: hypothetical protein M3394_07060 [Actinomycetota bacterium]|nr:hypothetical protein [Actinomycetota bacterium]
MSAQGRAGIGTATRGHHCADAGPARTLTAYDELGRALHRLARVLDELLLSGCSPRREHFETLRLLGTHVLHTLGSVADEEDRRRWGRSFEAGLRAAAENYGEATGAAPHVQIHGSADRLTLDVADAFRRVVSEALRNVDHHARASVLLVSLHVEDDGAVLDIVDDGVDLERRQVPEWNSSVELGLHRMARAMQAVGGNLSVHPLRPRGLRLCASAPVASRRSR